MPLSESFSFRAANVGWLCGCPRLAEVERRAAVRTEELGAGDQRPARLLRDLGRCLGLSSRLCAERVVIPALDSCG